MPGIADYMPGVAAGVSTVGNIISQFMANRANERLAAQANQWSIDQWNRENQYNLPINQVQRLQDAGINPGILYGQGGLMNEAAQSPGVTSARVSPYIMDPLTMAQVANINADTKQKEVQTDLFGSQIKVNESSIESDKIRLDLEGRRTGAEVGYLTKQTEMLDHKMQEIDASIEQIRANIRWTDAQTAKQDLENLFNEKSMQDRLDQEHQKFINMCKQYDLMDSELALNRQEFQQLAEMFVINKAQAEQTLAMLMNEREISDKTKLLDINNAVMENQANKVELAGRKLTLKVAKDKYDRWHGKVGDKLKYADDVLGSVGQVLSGVAMLAVPASGKVARRSAGFRQSGAN